MGRGGWCVALLLAACGDDLARLGMPRPDGAATICRVPITHPTIQSAVDEPDCPTVLIEPGLYDENVAIARDVALTAAGDPVTIDGGERDSVLIIVEDVVVTLTGLTVQHGRAVFGGGIRDDGPRGAESRGELVLIDTEVAESTASASYARGGGIDSYRPVRLTGSAVRDNAALGETAASGGGIAAGRVVLEGGSVVERNVSRSPRVADAGGIYAGTVIIDEGSSVRDNRAEVDGPQSGGDAQGGGIVACHTSVLGGSELAGNLAIARDANGGGVAARGGAVACTDDSLEPRDCEVVVTESSVADNRAEASGNPLWVQGGGIASDQCTVRIGRSSMRGNAAVAVPETDGLALGGAVYAAASRHFEIVESALTGNRAIGGSFSGGGALALEDRSGATPTIVDSTLSGNQGPRGGALASWVYVEIYSSTITNNDDDGEAGGIATLAELFLAGSILAGNSAPDLACDPDATSAGYNLIGDPGSCTLGGDTDLDRVGVNPRLRPLGDNGGPTPTHLPRAGSPAIDRGNPAGCLGPDETTLTSDQRGLPRPVGVCDVGAVEVQRGRRRAGCAGGRFAIKAGS